MLLWINKGRENPVRKIVLLLCKYAVHNNTTYLPLFHSKNKTTPKSSSLHTDVMNIDSFESTK